MRMNQQPGLRETQSQTHPNCVVCAPSNLAGLGLVFRVLEDGSVEATFDCSRQFEGYANVLHGGVIASALDGAMTNCLFARGVMAVTADLRVRFRHPVAASVPATVRAWIVEFSGPLHVMKARLIQNGQVKATASGKFVELPREDADGGMPA